MSELDPTPAAAPPSIPAAPPSIRGQLEYQEGQDTEAQQPSALYPALPVNPPPFTRGGDFVGGSGFGQSSSDTYGGMSGGQMVTGSAMGAGGAQFGESGFVDFGGGSQPEVRDIGGRVFGQPQQFGQPVVPLAGGLSTCACSRVCGCAYLLVWICFTYQTQFYINCRRQIMYQLHINTAWASMLTHADRHHKTRRHTRI